MAPNAFCRRLLILVTIGCVGAFELPPPLDYTDDDVNCPKLTAADSRCHLYCRSFWHGEDLLFCYGGRPENIKAAIEEYAVFLDVPPLPSIVESTTSGGNNTAELIPSDDENVEWQNETTTTPKTASAMPDVTAFKPTARLAIGVQSSEFETLDASVFASVADRVCYAGFFAPLRMTLMPNLSNMTALREIVVEDATRLISLDGARMPNGSGIFLNVRRSAVVSLRAGSLPPGAYFVAMHGNLRLPLALEAGAFTGMSSLNFLHVSDYAGLLADADALVNASALTRVTIDNVTPWRMASHELQWLGKANALTRLDVANCDDVEVLHRHIFRDGFSALTRIVLSSNRRLQEIEVDAFRNLPNLTVLEISNSPLTRFDVAAVDGIANVTLPLHYHDCSYCGFQRFRDALIARSLSPGIQAKADSYQCMVSNATFVGWLRLVDLDDSAFDPCDGDDAQFTPAPTKCLASELPEEEVLIEPESKALPLVADRLKAVPAGNHTSVPPPPIPMSSSTTSSESSTSPFFSYRLQQELSMNVATLLRDVSQHGGGDSSSDDQATTDYASVFAEIVRALGGATGGGGSSCRDRQPPVLIFKGDSGEGGDNGIPGLDGLPGLKGDKGARGYDGLPGRKGAKADAGERGERGIAGSPGEKGVKGDRGFQGPPGYYGVKGTRGSAGVDGPQGYDGAPGEKGDIGEPGAAGTTGARGSKGDKGDRGELGYQGWQGPKGDKGDKGAQGLAGDVGFKGVKGEEGDAITLPISSTTAPSTTPLPTTPSSLARTTPVGSSEPSSTVPPSSTTEA